MAEEKTQWRSKQAPCCWVACTPQTPPALPSQRHSNTVGNGGEKELPSSTPKSWSTSSSWTNSSRTCSTYGINWTEKKLATQLGICYGSGSTLLDRYDDWHSDKIFDACVCWLNPSKQPTICSSTRGLSFAWKKRTSHFVCSKLEQTTINLAMKC